MKNCCSCYYQLLLIGCKKEMLSLQTPGTTKATEAPTKARTTPTPVPEEYTPPTRCEEEALFYMHTSIGRHYYPYMGFKAV